MKRTFLKKVKKVWGLELWVSNNSYCGKILKLKKDFQCSLHLHKEKKETFLILSGEVRFELAKKVSILKPMDIVDIPRDTLHRFTGIKNSVMIEFSTHHENSDSFRVEFSGHV